MTVSALNARRHGSDLSIKDKDLATGKDIRRLIAENNETYVRGLKRMEEKFDAEITALHARLNDTPWRRLMRKLGR